MVDLLIPLGLALFAGLSTGLGSAIAFFIKKFENRYLSFLLGFSAGVMITISFVELLATATEKVGFEAANLAFFLGIALMLAVDYLTPHEYMWEKCKIQDKKLMKTGMFTAIGIAIHNIPEGLAILFGGLSSLKLGVILAIAIAIHNIPEGIAISVPIFCATKDRKIAFKYSFLSGLAEPAGALVGGLILLPFLTPALISSLLAFAAGTMVFISLDELIPTACECMYGEKMSSRHVMISGIILGMIVMTLSLWLLR